MYVCVVLGISENTDIFSTKRTVNVSKELVGRLNCSLLHYPYH